MPQRKNPHHTGTKPPAYTPNSPATARRRTEKHRSGASGNIEGIEKRDIPKCSGSADGHPEQILRTDLPPSHSGKPPKQIPRNGFPGSRPGIPPPQQRPHLRQLLTTTHPEQFPATNSHNNFPPHNKSTPTQRLPRNNSRNEKQRATPKCSPLFFCGSRSDYFALFLS